MTLQPTHHQAGDTHHEEDHLSADHDLPQRVRKRTLRPLWGGAIALALVLAACGSSDSDASKEPVKTDPAEGSASGDPDDSDSPSTAGGGTGTGKIEIGDIRHDLKIDGCVTLAGAISGRAVSVTEPDNVDVNFSFSPENWSERDDAADWAENGTVRLDREDPYEQWQSGASVFEGFNLPSGVEATDFTVTSYDVSDDGQSVTGEARFVELNAMLAGTVAEATVGTFAFSCPPKG